jgi:hypothetical protein
MAAEDILNNWAIFAIAAFLIFLLPPVMLFSRANKFDVKGKVRVQPLDHSSLA